MKYIIDEMEFFTERKQNKWLKYSLIVWQVGCLIVVGGMLAYSILMFGTN